MTKPADPIRPASANSQLDIAAIRAQFPILKTRVHGKPLVYFDNGATTQKPQAVIDVLREYYEQHNANIHRGVHTLSQEATSAYEAAREKIAAFINAAEPSEIIFTRGTTEGINLVAATFGRSLKTGDEIVISAMEHHSNIVPWQMLCETTGAILRVIPMNDRGELLLAEFAKILAGKRVKIVSVVHLSNSLGTINPVKQMIAAAHAAGAVVLVDGAQWVAHGPTDVRDLDADFYAFSGHKLYGPTGVGVLYGKMKLLQQMPPYQGGGDMIRSVSFAKTTYAEPPHRFEAGTPNIAGGIGLGAAIDFVQSIGLEKIARYENELLKHATEKLSAISGVRLIGTAEQKGSALSFVIDTPPISTLDVGMQLDAEGIAVRTGHHCCQPVMDRFEIPATARASLAMYNTFAEIDQMADCLTRIIARASKAPAKSFAPARANGDSQAVRYPTAGGDSPQSVADELAETFELLGDWEQRMQFVLDMGEKLLPMPAEFKTDDNRVRGCMSTVHLTGRRVAGDAERLEFLADSDAALVRGLIAILQKLFSGQPAREILEFDTPAFLKRIGLDQQLSMGRRSGLEGMIRRIRAEASEIATAVNS